LPSSICLPNPDNALSGAQCAVAVTPERNIPMNTYSMPEMESSLNLSVNSHTQKRRRSMGALVIDLTQDEQSDVPRAKSPACTSLTRSSIANRDATRRIEFGFESNCVEQKSKKSNVSPSRSENDYAASCVPSIPVMEKRLQISCSLCKCPLGLPENHLFVMCSLTTSSKVHLASLLKEKLKHDVDTPSVQVVMTETSSVHPELCTRTIKSAPAQGIWCEEDGCVFNTIFCPFCSNPSNFLGVQIVATDASNVQLLNKVSHYTSTHRTFYCA
jgi:Fanconi anemia group J protein